MSGGPLGLGGQSDADQPVLGLELLKSLRGVVDEAEAGSLTTTVLGPQAKDGDLFLRRLVHGGELLAELLLGDVGAVGVEDVTIETQKDVGQSGGSGRDSRDPMAPIPTDGLDEQKHRNILHIQSISSHRSGTATDKMGLKLTRPSACGQAEGFG